MSPRPAPLVLLFSALVLPALPAEVTYTRDIAPLVQERCVECHREGTGAPFSLTDYQSVRRRARTIIDATTSAFMPPWHAVGGDITLAGDRRLAAEEIALFQQWFDAGRPEGDPGELPAPRDYPEGWALGEPDLVITMAEAYALPADGPDIYRHFVIPTGLTEAKYVKAIDFRGSTPEVVHHSLIYLDTRGRAREVDEADPAPGFDEMPIGEGTGSQIGGWVPGAIARPLPEGMAHHLPPGSDIVLQTHFHLSGKPETEQSSVALYFTDEAPSRPFTSIQIPPIFGAFSGIDLQPGDADSEIRDTFELPVAVRAWGAHAHSHYRGKSLRMTAELPGGDTVILLNVPEWDMDWQEEYRFADEVALPAGTRLTTVVAWDNSATAPTNPVVPPVRVRWGLESYDEMGSIDLFVTAPEGDMKTLRRAYKDHVVWTAGSHVLGEDKLTVFGQLRDQAIARFDADKDGRLSAGERDAARASLGSKIP